MKKVFNTTVSVKEGASRSVLRGIIQYDTLNEVNIRLSDGSKAFDYTGYTNIIFKVLKADGTAYIDSEGENVIATAPMDGIVTVHLKGQATVAAGLCQSVIEVYSGDGKMTTARFNYEVFEALGGDDGLETAAVDESENYYPVFQNLMADLSALEASIEEAEAKRVAAEIARVALETGYVAQAQNAAVASSASASKAEEWAKQARDITTGDFATVTELGAATSTKAIADWDEARTNGWYSGAAGASNSPDSRYTWFGRVVCYTKDILMQEVWGLIDTTVYRHCVRFVYPNGGTPWEWVNPPMLVGVEYRTTERYMGMPVYKQLVDFGALPNATTKNVDVGFGSGFIIGIESVFSYNQGLLFHNYSGIESILGSGATIGITTTANMSEYNTRVLVKYYKTNDT